MKLAIFFPGIGYTNDRPLMYYSRKLLKSMGYEELCIEYHDLPEKVGADREIMKKAAFMAYEQAKEILDVRDLKQYDDIVFVGKSIGTILAAQYREDRKLKAKLVLYTPVEATFIPKTEDAIAFIGDKDPWSDLESVKTLAQNKGIPLYLYTDCNHSLECSDVGKNIQILADVMEKTGKYI